jgi:hypothetical protein
MPSNKQAEPGPFEAQDWVAHVPADWPLVKTGDKLVDYHQKREVEAVLRATRIIAWLADAVVMWDEFLTWRIAAASTMAEKCQLATMRERFRGLFDGNERPI